MPLALLVVSFGSFSLSWHLLDLPIPSARVVQRNIAPLAALFCTGERVLVRYNRIITLALYSRLVFLDLALEQGVMLTPVNLRCATSFEGSYVLYILDEQFAGPKCHMYLQNLRLTCAGNGIASIIRGFGGVSAIPLFWRRMCLTNIQEHGEGKNDGVLGIHRESI